jgi:hypothetical protein
MKTFREQLAQIAYGQLVDRGHVTPVPPKTCSGKRERREPQQRPVVRWPRLAMPH